MSLLDVFNKTVVATLPLVPKPLVGMVSRPYIAGISLDDAVAQIRKLNAAGMMATTDLLGEFIRTMEEAAQNEKDVFDILESLSIHRLDSNVSLKLTQLGLLLDKGQCYETVRRIVARAKERNNFVRIDMEDSPTVDTTFWIYNKLRDEGFDNVGVVIQAYLRRAEADVKTLMKRKANIRLCKGIYIEPEAIAFKEREEIRNNFIRLLEIAFDGGGYVGIATHDDVLVHRSYELIGRYGLRREQYEFQMLLGVRENLRDSIVAAGHRLRVYVPFGEKWYPYCLRRLRENPSVAGYVTKATIAKIFRLNNR